MAFTLVGKIVAVSNEETVASKSDATKTFKRRQVYLDCSRYDSITGERLQENYPLLEFGGKGLDQLNTLCQQGLKKGNLVSIDFVVQGNSYKDAQGKTKNFTGIRPYSIAMYVPKSQQQPPQQSVAVQQPQPQPQQQPQQAKEDDLPF